MKFFIDTADINEIKEASSMGITDALGIHPSLAAEAITETTFLKDWETLPK